MIGALVRTGPHPVSRRAAGTAAALHLAVAVLSVVLAVVEPTAVVPVVPAATVVAGCVVAPLQALAVLGVRRLPLVALLAFVALEVVGSLLDLPGSWVGLLALTYLLARNAVPGWPAALVATALVLLGVDALASVRSGVEPAPTAEDVAFLAVNLALAAAAGALRHRVQQRQRARAERETALRLERATVRERERIADELNGVALGALRRVAALAVGCRERLAGSAPERERALVELQAQARSALAAMRQVLVVLRAAVPAADDDGPVEEAGDGPVAPGVSGVVLAVGTALSTVALSLLPVPADVPVAEEIGRWWTVDPSRPAAVALLAVQIGSLLWWRTAPRTAFVVGSLAAAVAAVAGTSNAVADLSWLALALGLVAGTPPRRSVPLVVATTAGFVALTFLLGPQRTPLANGQPDHVAGVVSSLVLLVCVVVVGLVQRRSRLARAAAESAEAGRATRLVVEQERHRIARELHDVVAHFVSAVAVQAGAARAVADRDPVAVAEAAGHIEEYGRRIRRALPELADLSPPAHVVPLTASGVEQLVAPLRAAGLPISAEVRGRPVRHGGDAALFAQRILTEALTNVLRHAGPSATRVLVEHRSTDVVVHVADAGPAAPPPAAHGAGLGIVGMRERARLLGGELFAGPDGRGWTVTARLPHAGTPPPPPVPADRPVPAGDRSREQPQPT